MSDRIYTTQADSGTSQDFDGLWHTTGVELRLSAAGTLVGGRARYPSVNPSTSFLWLVYRLSDQAIMAQVDLKALFGSPSLSAWNSFTSANFATPGDVSLAAYPSESYVVVTATDRDVVYKNTSVSYPASSGGIVSGVNARDHTGGTGAVFPTSTSTTIYYFADVEVNAAAAGGVAKGGLFLPFFS